MRERAKGDRLEENMRDARMAEDREETDTAIYDLVDQFVLIAPPASVSLASNSLFQGGRHDAATDFPDRMPSTMSS